MHLDHDDGCCAEQRMSMSRRGLLRGATATAGLAVATSMVGDVFTEVAYAASGTADRVMVVLSLRGGADGLSLVVPHGDPAYARARPTIAVPTGALLARNQMFGLHPSFAPLMPLWNARRMATVHAAGLPMPNRSHFAAIEQIEDADPGSTARRGWLNRLIGLDTSTSPLQAVHLGGSAVGTALYGREPVVAVRRSADMVIEGTGDPTYGPARARALQTLWEKAPGTIGAAARSAFTVVDQYRTVQAQPATTENGATYPASDLGRAMADIARLLKAGVGAEAVSVDMGGWDMHAGLGTLAWGAMHRQVRDLAEALAAFFVDLGAVGDTVTVVTLSEFGRRVAENANAGLDHGYGGVMLLLGAGVRDGHRGRWPGLGEGRRVQGDLAVTTDYRSVLSEVVRSRFGASTSAVFPGFTPEPVGVMRLP